MRSEARRSRGKNVHRRCHFFRREGNSALSPYDDFDVSTQTLIPPSDFAE